VRISGWLPVSRLGDAIARPGVRRVAVERASRPMGDERLTGAYVVKLRVADASRPEESIKDALRTLTAQAGFKLDRTFAVEAASGGGGTVLASGTMPVSRLSRAMGLPSVISIDAALSPSVDMAAVAAEPSAPVKKEGFLKFVMARGLWLVVLTMLLVLPAMSEAVKKALSVFVPYR
jgi:hypothetical protein